MQIDFAKIREWLSRRETILTLVYCGAFLCLGLLLAGLGPSLPSLGRNTHTADEKMGATVTARAFGYLTGSASGPIFHKLPGNRMVAASLVIISVFCFLIPHMTSFLVLCFLFFFQGLSMGMLDTGANLMTLWMHGQQCDPYIQSLHAAFAVGAVIGPAIIKGLLTGHHPINAAWYAFGCSFVPIIIGLLYFPSPTQPHDDEEEAWKLEVAAQAAKEERADVEEARQVDIVSPYSVKSTGVELYDLNSAAVNPEKLPVPPPTRSPSPPSMFNFTWENRYSVDYKPYLTVLGVAAFLGCYVGGEVATGSFLTTFALRRGLTTEDGGALLTTIFWLTFALGRLAAIPLSIYVTPKSMLIVDLVGTMISTCLVWSFSNRLVPLALSLVLYGAFMASTFPSAITLLQTIIPVTGNMTTVFIVGASLGEMLVPLIVSSNFESTNYMSLIYVQFGSVVSGTIIMIGVGYLGYKLSEQKRIQEAVLNKVVEVAIQKNSEYMDGRDMAPVLYQDEDHEVDKNVKLEM